MSWFLWLFRFTPPSLFSFSAVHPQARPPRRQRREGSSRFPRLWSPPPTHSVAFWIYGTQYSGFFCFLIFIIRLFFYPPNYRGHRGQLNSYVFLNCKISFHKLTYFGEHMQILRLRISFQICGSPGSRRPFRNISCHRTPSLWIPSIISSFSPTPENVRSFLVLWIVLDFLLKCFWLCSSARVQSFHKVCNSKDNSQYHNKIISQSEFGLIWRLRGSVTRQSA